MIPVSVQPDGSANTWVLVVPELVEYTCKVAKVAPWLPVTVNFRWVWTGPVAFAIKVFDVP